MVLLVVVNAALILLLLRGAVDAPQGIIKPGVEQVSHVT
jgi:hypothetical protein